MVGLLFFREWGGCCVVDSPKVHVPLVVGVICGVKAFRSIAAEFEKIKELVCVVQ